MPPRLPLAAQRLIVITGKGGVGKTTVTAAFAQAAAAARRRVLAVEVGPGRLGALLGAATVSHEPTRIGPRLAVAYRAGVSRGWIAAGAGMVLLPLASGSLLSDGRFGLLAIPVYWGLAVAARDRRVHGVLLAVSLVLLAGVTLTIPSLFP